MCELPRSSARLRWLPPQVDGPTMDTAEFDAEPNSAYYENLTASDDVTCTSCGLADGVLGQFPCCSAAIHQKCRGTCTSCDLDDISDMGSLEVVEDCLICRCDKVAPDRITHPCCGHALHMDCIARSFRGCGARCPFCQANLIHIANSEQFRAFPGIEDDVSVDESAAEVDIQIPAPPHCNRIGGPPEFHLSRGSPHGQTDTHERWVEPKSVIWPCGHE